MEVVNRNGKSEKGCTMSHDPDEIHFDCPKCKRPMSGDKALLGEMITCPDCGEPFVPSPRKVAVPDYSPQEITKASAVNAAQLAQLESKRVAGPQAESATSKKIRRLAKNFTWAAAGLACIAVLTLFATVVCWHSATSERMAGVPEDQISTGASGYWHITTWCISAALLLFAIGQIVHIRANTEK